MHHNALQRQQILEVLYAVREAHPRRGWLAEAKLKEALENADLEFALGVLIELGQIKRDGYQLIIS